MAGFCVGSMDTSVGFETESPILAMSRHFLYYFTSRRDQGKVIDKTPSFYWTWKEYGENPDTLISKSKEELKTYYNELFPNVFVDCAQVAVNGSTTQYALQFAVQVSYQGVTYDLSQSVYVDGQQYKVLDKRRLT